MTDTSEVKLHFLDYWRIIKARAGLVALTFFLVMVTAGVTTYFLPRQYYSKVTMELKSDKPPIEVFERTSSGFDPMFIPTQFQILRKTSILYPVIDNLRLVEKWSGEGGRKLPYESVYMKLLGMLDFREVRNSSLVEVGVYSTDPVEAANIANTLAVVYKEDRLERLRANNERGLAELRLEVDSQGQRVAAAYAEMSQIRIRDGIVDPDPESFQSNVSAADRDVIAIEKEYHEERMLLTRIEGQFERIMKMEPKELREVMRTLNIESQSVIRMVANLEDMTAKEADLYNSGLGENHPRLMSARAQKEVFLANLADSLRSTRESQATRLEIERSNLAKIEARLEEARKGSIEDKQKVAAYTQAKSFYLHAKRIFEAAHLKLSTALLEKGLGFEPAVIREKAEPSGSPAKPNVPAYMALAAVIGLVVGVGLAFFIEYLDTSVKSLDDVEKHLQVPVLAVIPKEVSTLIKANGDTPDAEAYRILRANVEFNKPSRNANTITLVSGGPGEGKSTTLNNLAFTCAQGGYNVLVVDADLRRPTQHTFFDQENDFGLVDYLVGRAEVDEIVTSSKHDNLSFIPSGQLPGESVGILNSQRMVDLIAKVKGQYDLVFFDAPPILGVSDGAVLASECDITIMVVQHRRFPRAMLLRVKQAVANSGGRLIGVVLNNVDAKHDEGYAYYNNYQDYYAKPRDDKKSSGSASAPRKSSVATPSAPSPATAPASVTSTATLPVKSTKKAPQKRSTIVDDEDY